MNEPLPTPPDAVAPLLPDAVQARIEFLFRIERRRGLIHPLQHILQRYRADERPLPPPRDEP